MARTDVNASLVEVVGLSPSGGRVESGANQRMLASKLLRSLWGALCREGSTAMWLCGP